VIPVTLSFEYLRFPCFCWSDFEAAMRAKQRMAVLDGLPLQDFEVFSVSEYAALFQKGA